MQTDMDDGDHWKTSSESGAHPHTYIIHYILARFFAHVQEPRPAAFDFNVVGDQVLEHDRSRLGNQRKPSL